VAGLVAPALEDYLGNEAAEVIPFPDGSRRLQQRE